MIYPLLNRYLQGPKSTPTHTLTLHILRWCHLRLKRPIRQIWCCGLHRLGHVTLLTGKFSRNKGKLRFCGIEKWYWFDFITQEHNPDRFGVPQNCTALHKPQDEAPPTRAPELCSKISRHMSSISLWMAQECGAKTRGSLQNSYTYCAVSKHRRIL